MAHEPSNPEPSAHQDPLEEQLVAYLDGELDDQSSRRIEELLATLSPREARILRLRFGLLNGYSHTLEEVGQKFGLTRERIRQIEGKALRRLRHPRRSRELRGYLG